MAESFTWFAKFADVFDLLDEDDRKELAAAIAMYGMYGAEPERLPFHLSIAFAAMREDVDHSKSRRAGGVKGARAKAAKSASEPVSQGGSQGTCEGGPDGTAQGTSEGVPEGRDVEPCKVAAKVPRNPIQNSTGQTVQVNTGHNKERGAGKPRFAPPRAEEVEAYAKEAGLNVDARSFVDHFSANGWKVGGRAPMKDWKAAARNWSRRQDAYEGGKGERDGDGYVFDF